MKDARFILRRVSRLIVVCSVAATAAQAQGVYRQLWTGLTASQGNTLAVLTNTAFNPNWPNNPNATYTQIIPKFETETNLLSNYGQRLRTFIVPPTNGTYTFWIASDDSSQLFLSADETPANMVAIANVNAWTNPREWTREPNQQSSPIALQAGRRYYAEAIMQEGDGGDNLAVRWRLPNNVFEEPLVNNSAAGTRLIPFTGSNSMPGFFIQPEDKTVAEGLDAVFSLLATNRAPVAYQWQRSSTNLPGANQPVLTVSSTSFALDDGKVFRCVVSNASGSVTSSPATLTVIADTTPSTLVSANNQDTTHIVIVFSEAVELASATNATNYSVSSGVNVLSGALINPQTVNLTVSSLTLAVNYTVTVSNVRDRASVPNTIAPNSQINFTAQAYGLSARPNIGPFLNNQVPTAAPGISGNWSAVVAFTNLYFTNALGLAAMPGTNKLIVWEREGRIWSFTTNLGVTSKTLVLNITNQCQGWDDSGLLNVVFHPGFATNRYIFVYYTWVPPGTVVGSPTARPAQFLTDAYHDRLSRFTLDANGVAIPGSELVLVDQTGTSTWHNGSGMFFHPASGFLYVTDGDDADYGNNDQVITNSLFGGIWRLDVDMRGGSISHPIPRQPNKGTTANYYIPNDNPFVGQANALEEFYAIGLRSPHRMTFDPTTGRIFIGDVGEGSREEISVVEPGDPAGLNFQWNFVEGFLGVMPPSYIGVSKPPILDYTHSEGQAVIGGYVYRGSEFASDLGGRYIFGDNVTRRIWAMDESTSPAGKILLCTLPRGPGDNSGTDYLGLSSFGLDHNNELYFCQMGNLGGRIYKLARSGPPPADPFPLLLSQTGVFTNLLTLAPRAELIPFNVNSPLWSDGAVKTRWVAIPTNTLITFSPTGEWQFPNGSVFVKNFDLPVDDTNTNIVRRLETRLLVRDTNGNAYGITYRWRTDYTEADLVTNAITENIVINTGSGSRTQQWYYPGPQDCLLCHTPAASHVLGVKTRQLNGDFFYSGSGVTDNQLRAWNHIGLFDTSVSDGNIPTYDKLVKVTDTTATLTNRVRSYLDANCAQCHRPGGVQALWDARYDTPLENQGIINGNIVNTLGILGAKEVVPQDIAKSIMHLRMNSLGSIKMPPLARNTVDSNAVATLTAWINGLVAPPILMTAHYQFEGNAQDTSGSDNHGTANNVTYVAGKVGAQAAQFNGSSSYVQIPRSISTDFSVTMWVKTTDTGGTGPQWWSGKGLVDGEVAGAAADWGTAVLNSKFALGMGNPDTTVSSLVNINDGTWHHVAATRDNTSGAMNVYVDGVLGGSGTGPIGARTAPPNLRIGSIQTGSPAAAFLNGTIDDVQIYDRVLTAGEIAAMVNPPAAPANLVAAAGDGEVALSWQASSGATSYYVKRSTVSGGSYTVIATNVSVALNNTGLNNGTLYYYVASALNASGESPDSAEASARPTSSVPPQMDFGATPGQFQLSWPFGHTGWQLQVQTNSPGQGIGTNWTPLTTSASTNQFTMPIDATKGSLFFRLVHP